MNIAIFPIILGSLIVLGLIIGGMISLIVYVVNYLTASNDSAATKNNPIDGSIEASMDEIEKSVAGMEAEIGKTGSKFNRSMDSGRSILKEKSMELKKSLEPGNTNWKSIMIAILVSVAIFVPFSLITNIVPGFWLIIAAVVAVMMIKKSKNKNIDFASANSTSTIPVSNVVGSGQKTTKEDSYQDIYDYHKPNGFWRFFVGTAKVFGFVAFFITMFILMLVVRTDIKTSHRNHGSRTIVKRNGRDKTVVTINSDGSTFVDSLIPDIEIHHPDIEFPPFPSDLEINTGELDGSDISMAPKDENSTDNSNTNTKSDRAIKEAITKAKEAKEAKRLYETTSSRSTNYVHTKTVDNALQKGYELVNFDQQPNASTLSNAGQYVFVSDVAATKADAIQALTEQVRLWMKSQLINNEDDIAGDWDPSDLWIQENQVSSIDTKVIELDDQKTYVSYAMVDFNRNNPSKMYRQVRGNQRALDLGKYSLGFLFVLGGIAMIIRIGSGIQPSSLSQHEQAAMRV